jgi:hypothetical protein
MSEQAAASFKFFGSGCPRCMTYSTTGQGGSGMGAIGRVGRISDFLQFNTRPMEVKKAAACVVMEWTCEEWRMMATSSTKATKGSCRVFEMKSRNIWK